MKTQMIELTYYYIINYFVLFRNIRVLKKYIKNFEDATSPIFIMGFGSVKIDTHLRQGSTRNLIFSLGQGGILNNFLHSFLVLISSMLKFFPF
jgi:hypothetical protein